MEEKNMLSKVEINQPAVTLIVFLFILNLSLKYELIWLTWFFAFFSIIVGLICVIYVFNLTKRYVKKKK
jgi:hypothetical protein